MKHDVRKSAEKYEAYRSMYLTDQFFLEAKKPCVPWGIMSALFNILKP